MSINTLGVSKSIFGNPLKKGGLSITLLGPEKNQPLHPSSPHVRHYNTSVTIVDNQTFATNSIPAELVFDLQERVNKDVRDERFRELFTNVKKRDFETVANTIRELLDKELNTFPEGFESEENRYFVRGVEIHALNDHVVDSLYLESVDTSEEDRYDYEIFLAGNMTPWSIEKVNIAELPRLNPTTPNFPIRGNYNQEQQNRLGVIKRLFCEYAERNLHRLHRDADRFLIKPMYKDTTSYGFDSALVILSDNDWKVYTD